jgi:hypothetical protein
LGHHRDHAAVCIGVGINCAGAQSAHIEESVDERGLSSKLELMSAERNALYQEVHKGWSKAAPSRFATDVGADVPPIIATSDGSFEQRTWSRTDAQEPLKLHRLNLSP